MTMIKYTGSIDTWGAVDSLTATLEKLRVLPYRDKFSSYYELQLSDIAVDHFLFRHKL